MTPLINRDELIKQLIERRQKVGLTREELAATIRRKHNHTIIANTIFKIDTKKIKGSYDYFYLMDDVISDFEKSQKNNNILAESNNENKEH